MEYVNTVAYANTKWYLLAMHDRLNRQERKSQTRERLLDAAAVVFAERGFETASLDEVAAAAGYTKGAVYSNFESKADLLIALLKRRIEVQSAQYSQRIEGQDVDTVVRRLTAGGPDRLPDSERQFLVLLVEFWLFAMREERTRPLMAEQYERGRTFIGGLIASLYASAGQQPPMAPRDLAIVIEALGVGLAFQAALDPGAVRLSLESEVMARLLGLQLAADPAPSLPSGEPTASDGVAP